MSVFHASVLLLIMHFVITSKVAVDPRGDSRVDPQTILTMLCRNSLSITGQTHLFLSSYRNTSESLGEREMLWEYEPQASVSTAFSSSPKLSRVFL